jgi:hypothetical protein
VVYSGQILYNIFKVINEIAAQDFQSGTAISLKT